MPHRHQQPLHQRPLPPCLLLPMLLLLLCAGGVAGKRRMAGGSIPLSTTGRLPGKLSYPVLEVEHRDKNTLMERADIEKILKDGLEPDLALWAGRQLTMKEHYVKLVEMVALQPSNSIVRQALIWDNKLYWPDQPTCDAVHTCCQCNWFFEWFEDTFNNVWSKAATWPNVLFLFNVGDHSMCASTAYNATLEDELLQRGEPLPPPGDRKCIVGGCLPCPAPVLSMVKMWPSAVPDILLPYPLKEMDYPFYNFPWRHKEPRAVFRGEMRCSLHDRWGLCSRVYMSALTNFNNTQLLPVACTAPASGCPPALSIGDVLDAGLVEGFGYKDGEDMAIAHLSSRPRQGPLDLYLPGSLPRSQGIPIKDHSRYKFLLALDGITASSRLGKLLHTNSVVLKEESPYIEWYYRSLVAGHHYLPIWKDSPVDVLALVARYSGTRQVEAASAMPSPATAKGARVVLAPEFEGTVALSTEHGAGGAPAPAEVQRRTSEDDKMLKGIARNAQQFASRYTGGMARMRYYIEALTAVRDMFPDMDTYVQRHVLPRVLKAMPKEGGPPARRRMAQRRAHH